MVSALSLGLGIGANTLLYMGISKMYGGRPTMRNPKSVVGVELGVGSQFSYPEYDDLVQTGIFDGVLGFRKTAFNFGSKNDLRRVDATVVTGNYFELLGIPVASGRTFSGSEMRPQSEPRVAIVTAGFWRDRLNRDRSAAGKSILLNGEAFTVIGVLPDNYQAVTGWNDRSIYVPVSKLTLPSLDDRVRTSLTVLARLRASQSISEAEQAVIRFNRRLDAENEHRIVAEVQRPAVFPSEKLQFRGSPALLMLMKIAWALALSVLLIACVNVTGLLLARATERAGEVAVRGVLGAGRLSMAQLMVVESFLVVAAGAAIGLPLASVVNRIPMPLSMTPLQDAMALDSRVLPYAAALLGFTTLICGAMPALRMMRMDLNSQMKMNLAGRVTPRTWWREMIVAGQVVITFVLVVAAIFCVRSQFRITHADFGFDIDHGVVAQFGLPWNAYPKQERVALADRLTRRIEQIPGVSSVGVADLVPLGGNGLVKSFHPAGRNDIRGTRPDSFSVGPGYFRTLSIQLLKGREFESSDQRGAASVVIVNETYARTYFSSIDVIGRSVRSVEDPDAHIVGVARDSRIDTIGEIPRSVIYYPFAQHPSDLTIHVRCAVPPETLVSAVKQAIRETNDTVPVTVQTLREATSLEMTMRRVGMVLMGVLGAVGLMLAAIGLYGLMAFVAASRTADVAIRMALGASRSRILWEMLRRALIVVVPSVLFGASLSLVIMPRFRTFLAGVSPFDPVAFGGAATIFLLTGLAAACVPARRNARLDPMAALRGE